MASANYRRTQDATPPRPQPIKEVLAELIVRRGYAREQSSAAFQTAWQTVAGEFFAKHTRCGQVRRGVLEVFVANSILMQELTFCKPQLLQELSKLLPETAIKDIRLRVAAMQ
jgi:predicted nucleic acid-binding Zn ribbon protein